RLLSRSGLHGAGRVRAGRIRGVAGLRGRTSDAFRTVRAEYLVAAGGAHSRIRDRLGIAMTGHDHMSDGINVLFAADLSPALGGTGSIVFRLRNPWLPMGGIPRSNHAQTLEAHRAGSGRYDLRPPGPDHQRLRR